VICKDCGKEFSPIGNVQFYSKTCPECMPRYLEEVVMPGIRSLGNGPTDDDVREWRITRLMPSFAGTDAEKRAAAIKHIETLDWTIDEYLRTEVTA
jgi:hypothetical protein